ncbi:unnamed protein product [marine sediment metagenome]|uniref:ArnR1-like winged helix-turn-helix domain-containing protein n=1 Tax=marine sediment metagenome TaxID=412755 RepID=X1CE09_9ZZZZ
MSRRRSRLEITLSILSAVREGKDKPTNIIYAVNLSWKSTQRTLSNLVEQGLLEMRTASGRSKRLYTITERGVDVLDYFEKAPEILCPRTHTSLSQPLIGDTPHTIVREGIMGIAAEKTMLWLIS